MEYEAVADYVNSIDPPPHHVPGMNWQMLGQLKLRPSSNPDGIIKSWLEKTLNDFSLPDDLVSRLMASIEETRTRVLSPDSLEGQSKYLEIAVLAPAGQASNGHAWGFFRLERATADSPIESAKGRCVEYYLYLDRKTEK